MRTRARRVACVVFDEVELFDLASVIAVLTSAGRRWNFRPFKIDLCSATPGLVGTRNQLRFEAPSALATAPPADVLFVPGGYGARAALAEPELLAAIQRLGATAEIVAAIGWGVPLLAGARLIGSSKIAAGPDIADALRELVPATQLDPQSHVLSEDRVLTARGTGDALELGLAIVARALGPKMSAMVGSELGMPPSLERIEVKY